MYMHAADDRRAPWRRRACAALLLLVMPMAARADENLIANPGFEALSGSMPLRWDVFVQPAEGASGRLVDDAHSGAYAVQLQIATPYGQDPANNWSQNIVGEFGGKRLRLSGFIKVQEAEDAAIWVQCWRKEPWRVLSVASTSTRAPVYGTKDWDETFIEFDVPQNTDYLTVRCVIKGSGTAYFDDLSLMEIGEAKRPARTTETTSKTQSSMKDDKKAAAKTPLGQSLREETELLKLREENRMLKDTVDSLRTSNEDLLKRVKALEGQIEKP